MEFSCEADEPIADPSDSEIRDGILKIDGKKNSFAILSIDEMTYIQTSGSPLTGFVLEYQNGSLENHYRASDLIAVPDKIIAAFISYRLQDGAWQEGFVWEKDDLSQGNVEAAGNGCVFLVALAIGFVSAIFLFGRYAA